jgi:hypothetical protein
MLDRYDHEMDIVENSIKRVELSRERLVQMLFDFVFVCFFSLFWK